MNSLALRLLLASVSIDYITGLREFKIDYEQNCFLKDGQPFQYISGSLLYFRVHPYYWRDRLLKMKAAGLNAVQTYVPWNLHEPFEGKFNFEGFANLTGFLDIVHELGFVAIVRSGPYISSEWENGGLPWWLLKQRDIRMRSSDPRYLSKVEAWYTNLFPKLIPYLWRNGGPIALVGVENEYGSFSTCDVVYTAYLRDLFHSFLGYETVLFTTDGPSIGYLKCGFIPAVYPSIDNYASKSAFQAQRTYAPRGPLINSEFYPGWFDAWGSNYSSRGVDTVGMRYMHSVNASYNFYIFQGCTNFGYMNGYGSLPITTTYQFDAPISEAGDPTPKYFTIRETIQNLTGIKPIPVPPATPKKAYGKVLAQLGGSVFENLAHLVPWNNKSLYPLSMEDVDFPYGFILYETKIPSGIKAPLNLTGAGVADRGYVMVNELYQGRLIRQMGNIKNHSVMISGNPGDNIQILVENMGRTVTGNNDPKGIIQNITLNGQTLTSWTISPIVLENLFKPRVLHSLMKSYKSKKFDAKPRKAVPGSYVPSIFFSVLYTNTLEDTFFDSTGWGKGQFLINGYNVGRYWPSLGPQVTLYVPKPFMINNERKGASLIVMLELEAPGNCYDSTYKDCYIRFTDVPNLNKTVKPWNNGPTPKLHRN